MDFYRTPVQRNVSRQVLKFFITRTDGTLRDRICVAFIYRAKKIRSVSDLFQRKEITLCKYNVFDVKFASLTWESSIIRYVFVRLCNENAIAWTIINSILFLASFLLVSLFICFYCSFHSFNFCILSPFTIDGVELQIFFFNERVLSYYLFFHLSRRNSKKLVPAGCKE